MIKVISSAKTRDDFSDWSTIIYDSSQAMPWAFTVLIQFAAVAKILSCSAQQFLILVYRIITVPLTSNCATNDYRDFSSRYNTAFHSQLGRVLFPLPSISIKVLIKLETLPLLWLFCKAHYAHTINLRLKAHHYVTDRSHRLMMNLWFVRLVNFRYFEWCC